MKQNKSLKLVDIYYFLFVLNVIQSMAFPNSSFSGLISRLALGMGFICIIGKRKMSIKPNMMLVTLCGILFIAICYISAMVSGTNNSLLTTSGRLKSVLTITLHSIFFAIYDDLNLSAKKLNTTFLALSIGLMISTFTAYNFTDVINAVISGKRLGADVSAINLFGMTACMMAIYFLHLIIHSRKYILVKIFGLVILSVLTASSGSRGALLCLLIGGLFYVLLITSQNNRIIKVLKISILLVVILYLMSLFEYTSLILDRISTVWRQQDIAVAASDASRMRLITFGLQQWLKRPIFGYGFNAFTSYSRSVVSFSTYSHNNYIELLFNNGLVGLITFYVPKFMVLIEFVRVIKSSHISDYSVCFLVTEMVVLLFFDLTIVSYYYISLNYIWLFGYAYLYHIRNRTEQNGDIEYE